MYRYVVLYRYASVLELVYRCVSAHFPIFLSFIEYLQKICIELRAALGCFTTVSGNPIWSIRSNLVRESKPEPPCCILLLVQEVPSLTF